VRRAAWLLVLALAACSSPARPRAAPPTTSVAPSTVAPTTTIPPTTTIDPGALPQTADRPSGTDPAFLARMQVLWRAVVSGDALSALPAFFPEAAYLQVKAIANPDADWHQRLVALYDGDITRLHAALRGRPASLVAVDVPDGAAVWVRPGAEYNKGSYWRVYGTVVRYEVGGRAADFEVQSLISWRGQWYVVHLTTPPS
jgi:hypothetical protein